MLFKKILKQIFIYLNISVALFGYYQIGLYIEENYKLLSYHYLLLPVVLIGIYNFYKWLWLRRWGVDLPEEQRYLYLDVKQIWNISQSGKRYVYCKKVYLFYKNPEEKDLSDVVFGSLDIDFDQMNYYSIDSKVVNIEKISKHAYRVYWKPENEEIKIGKPYTHEFQFEYPEGSGDKRKSITIATSVYCVRTIILIKTEKRYMLV